MRKTINDIARQAGVSKTTVSFAFNDPSRLSRATLDKIMAVADELGYVPDPIARTLATRRVGAIGLLLPQPIHEALRNPYLGELIQGIGAACLEHEYMLMIVPPVRGRVMDAARRAVVDALVAIGLGPLDDMINLMKNRHIPLVTIDGDAASGVMNVGIDDEQAAFDLMNHLLGLGHRRFAVIGLDEEPGFAPGVGMRLTGGKRMAGLRRALSGWADAGHGKGLGDDAVEVYRASCSLDGGREAAATILAHSGATAIVTMADIMAMGVYRLCRETGVAIPDDLSVASFDDTELCSLVQPGLTSIRHPGYMKGYTAGRALLAAMASRGEVPVAADSSIIMPHELMVRGSTAGPGLKPVARTGTPDLS